MADTENSGEEGSRPASLLRGGSPTARKDAEAGREAAAQVQLADLEESWPGLEMGRGGAPTHL